MLGAHGPVSSLLITCPWAAPTATLSLTAFVLFPTTLFPELLSYQFPPLPPLLTSLFLMPTFLLVSHQVGKEKAEKRRSTILFAILTTLHLHSCETGVIQQPCFSSPQRPECKEGYFNGDVLILFMFPITVSF